MDLDVYRHRFRGIFLLTVCEIEKKFDRFKIDYINQVIRFEQNAWIKVILTHLFKLNRSGFRD